MITKTKKRKLLDMVLESPLSNLKLIPRFSDIYMHRRETVADHNWDLIALALVIVPEWNKDLEKRIDLKDVLYRIAVHDLDESGSIDIPRPFKYFNMDLKKKIDEVSLEILRSKKVSEDIIKDIKTAKDFATLEGFVVKILDIIQPGLVMIDEISIGNTKMKRELPNIIGQIDYFFEVLDYEDMKLEQKLRDRIHDFLNDFQTYICKFQ